MEKVFVVCPRYYFGLPGGSPKTVIVTQVTFEEWLNVSNPEFNGKKRYVLQDGQFIDRMNGENLGDEEDYYRFLSDLMRKDQGRMYVETYSSQKEATDALYDEICFIFSEDAVDGWLANNENPLTHDYADYADEFVRFQDSFVGLEKYTTDVEGYQVYDGFVFL